MKAIRIEIEKGAKTCLKPGKHIVYEDGPGPYIFILPNGGIIHLDKNQCRKI